MKRRIAATAILFLTVNFAGCGGGGVSSGGGNGSSSVTICSGGVTVSGPDGMQVVIPAGA